MGNTEAQPGFEGLHVGGVEPATVDQGPFSPGGTSDERGHVGIMRGAADIEILVQRELLTGALTVVDTR